jgi:HEAT repeat protein
MHDPSAAAIPTPVLVDALDDLARGDHVQALLILRGREAIAPLARFLLRGPSLHPQPRMRAAEALAAIGGDDAIAALVHGLTVGDPPSLPLVYRLPEEAVRGAVARALGDLGAPGAADALLDALTRLHLIDAGAALARLGDTRAVPPLVACLDDPALRERAAAVLVHFGAAALDAVIDGLERHALSAEDEPLWSVERRARCARVLGDLRDGRAGPALRGALRDAHAAVRIEAALALTRLYGRRAGADVAPALLEGLHGDALPLVDDCVEALVTLGAVAVPLLVGALTGETAAEEARGERMPGRAACAMARALGQLGATAEAALARLAEHRQPFVRALAVAHLGVGASERATRVFRRALRDRDARVRRTAAARLKELAGARRA